MTFGGGFLRLGWLAGYQWRSRSFFVNGVLSATFLFALAAFGGESKAEIDLTSEETAWLRAHPVIRYSPDPDYAPLEFYEENNRSVGIAADYLRLISEKLAVQVEVVYATTWSDALRNVKHHKADLVTVAAKTPKRSEYMLFTSPYIRLPDVIMVREQVEGDLTMADLKGKTVSAIEAWAANDYIMEHYPEIRLKMVPDVETALRETSFGTVDATILGLATASYWIEKAQITNLRVAGESGYVYELCFASRKDWPQLSNLLEKALTSITATEKKDIYNRWISVDMQAWRPGPKFWMTLGAGVLLLLITSILFWNRLLQREVRARTTALQAQLTERKRAEEQTRLLQAQLARMGRLTVAGEMVSGMAHELNQPLTAIVSYAQTCLLFLKSGRVNAEDLRKVIEQVVAQGQRAAEIIRRMRNSTRKTAPQRAAVSVNTLVGEVAALVEAEVRQQEVTIRLALTEPMPSVVADSTQIQQVLLNLMRNGIEAMCDTEAGKRVLTLKTMLAADDGVEVTVHDTGSGLPPEATAQLFLPFFTTKASGMGLGLSVSHSIIEAHGGRLWVTSGSDGGATFHFALPIARGAYQHAAVLAERIHRG